MHRLQRFGHVLLDLRTNFQLLAASAGIDGFKSRADSPGSGVQPELLLTNTTCVLLPRSARLEPRIPTSKPGHPH